MPTVLLALRWSASLPAALAAALAVSAAAPGTARGQSEAPGEAESLEAWQRIASVLQHPRCINCHQVAVPLQGDAGRVHVPPVVRGPDDHGVSAMRCGNCHNEVGNNPTSGTPGAPHWALAPVEMQWQGLSVAELCAQLKDPARNGGRSPGALLEHMTDDPLVGWGWQPGAGREPVPIAREDFAALMQTWVDGGTACPS